MTIRQLLSHRSGVHEPQSLEEPPHLDTLTDRDLVKIFGTKPLDFEPGTSAHYSNVGYVLLGMILEKATGASIGAVLDSSIFDPAGMDDSVLAPTQWDVRGYAGGKDVTADTGSTCFRPLAVSYRPQRTSTASSTIYGPGSCCHRTWSSR